MERKGVSTLEIIYDFFIKRCDYSLILILSISNAMNTMSKHDITFLHELTIKSFINSIITFFILDFIINITWSIITRIGHKKYPDFWIWGTK